MSGVVGVGVGVVVEGGASTHTVVGVPQFVVAESAEVGIVVEDGP